MQAIRFIKGKSVDIYLLEHKNHIEVKEFFDRNKNNRELRGVISGFIKIITTLASEGYIFPEQLFKCWTEQKECFCEIIKGRHRISCFKYDNGRKLLLVTYFIKKTQKEKKEYTRALRLKKAFDERMDWRE
jgi:hypothetical protein